MKKRYVLAITTALALSLVVGCAEQEAKDSVAPVSEGNDVTVEKQVDDNAQSADKATSTEDKPISNEGESKESSEVTNQDNQSTEENTDEGTEVSANEAEGSNEEEEVVPAIQCTIMESTNLKYRYQFLGEFKDGLCIFRSGGREGFIDVKENIVVEAKYDYVEPFTNGLAYVKVNELSGLINTSGEYVLKPEYTRLVQKDDRYWVTTREVDGESLWGAYDADGTMILDEIYDDVTYGDHAFDVEKDGFSGYMNNDGTPITEIKYDTFRTTYFSDGLARIGLDYSKNGFINKKGEFVIKPTYYGCENVFENGYAVMKNEDKSFVVIDKEGNEIQTFSKYKDMYTVVADGVLTYVVRTKDKSGLLDANLNELLKEEYRYINHREPFIVVEKDSAQGLVNAKGETIVPIKYSSVWPIADDKYIKAYKYDDTYDLYDINGKLIKETDFTFLTHIEGTELFRVKDSKGYFGIVDKNCNFVLEPKYSMMHINYELGRGKVTLCEDGVWKFATIDY